VSGICGVARFDGSCVEPAEFTGWAQRLLRRGPDSLGIRVEGGCGLGHALLRTGTRDCLCPATLDGTTWIVADARIDAREALAAALRARGVAGHRDDGDAELILKAYRAWGIDCPRHLLGDFAFAIWNERERWMFCARDHFGVKPFFHSWDGRRFAFSNDLGAMTAWASAAVDELAIADFLVFEANRDPWSTAFAAIRRLPPAHWLRLDAAGLSHGRYWSLPLEPTVVHRRDAREYVDGFRETLATAVRDRSDSERICVHMSGGLDSPAVAAALRDCTPASNVVAHTAIYERLFVDDEKVYAQAAADALRIPIVFYAGDHYRLYERRDELSPCFPEPANRPLAAFEVDLAANAASHGRVALTGWDGDTLLSESPRPYFRFLLRQRRLGRLAREGASYAFAERKILPAGALRRLAAKRAPAVVPLPPWINEDFARRLDLRERARSLGEVMRPGAHPIRPYASRILDYIALRSNFFDAYDPGFTGVPVEFRHPMLDLRLVDYCLSLPAYPWCIRKHVLRAAMRGILPDEVVDRPKTPLAGFPYMELLKDEASRWIDQFQPCAATTAYVNRAKIPMTRDDPDPERAWLNLRPLGLDQWMRSANFGIQR
jgi:asparagine synthase (glutamine-hydrolysing)